MPRKLQKTVNHKFVRREKVYALDQRGEWYKGTVEKLDQDIHPTSREPVAIYKVHYANYKHSMDEWLLEECLLKFTEESQVVIEEDHKTRFPERFVKQESDLEDNHDQEEIHEDDDEGPARLPQSRTLSKDQKVELVLDQIRQQMMTFAQPRMRLAAYERIGMAGQLDRDPLPRLEYLTNEALRARRK